MAINKVVYGGNTLVDLTGDTVSAADVVSGKTFHLPNGEQATGTLGCQILEFTLSTHKSTNVTIGTLSDEAYSHIDDVNFSVSMINTSMDNIVVYDDFRVLAQNNPNAPTISGGYPVYGCANRKTGEVNVQHLPCYYPPNSTDNATGL